ncbi:hypothetical protein [Ideonella sp. BN130291]|uniref:hypothetical protein n=1 Tax=Ideonella sp. BN130291 TaxID=3112940 RepID=UPI002E25366F|nr:hypothetical protein [Ideonella sp. BN130291]
MSDENQIHVPPSFTALYSDARQRLSVPMAELRARYELCEDLAQQLVDHSQQVHHDLGVSQDEVLARSYAGLCSADSGFSGAEAGWVVRRLAEVLGWPWDDAVLGG